MYVCVGGGGLISGSSKNILVQVCVCVAFIRVLF